MRARIVLLLVLCLLVTSGSIVNAQMCGKEYYQYYYTDAAFTNQVGHCAQNDSCTGYNYCSGTTNTNYRIWETASCCTNQGGCHCAQLINGVWTRIECPETAPCWSPVYP